MKRDAVAGIDGVIISALKIIPHPKGDILHAMKASNRGYAGFGEAYFSMIRSGDVKGWKKHIKMTLNLIVPVGEIDFVIYDDREWSDTKGKTLKVTLSNDNYRRLTIAPGLWLAFQGKAEGLNLLLNIADLEHDPNEAVSIGLNDITYEW